MRTLESDVGVSYEAWVRHFARVPGADFPCSLCVVAAGEPGHHGALPAAVTSTAIPAEVNHGQWIVKCPFCPSAQQASQTDLRFFCTECHNKAAGGKWLPVAWPGNREALEELLEERPALRNRNWLPTETAQDLRAENAANGVGGDSR